VLLVQQGQVDGRLHSKLLFFSRLGLARSLQRGEASAKMPNVRN